MHRRSLQQKCCSVQQAMDKHGRLNSYYLHNASCSFHLTNDPVQGLLRFGFEGVVLTDAQDLDAQRCDLQVELQQETCSWVDQSIVDWFAETVRRAVLFEFNRYIQQGDLSKTVERLEKLEQANEQAGGYVGMYL